MNFLNKIVLITALLMLSFGFSFLLRADDETFVDFATWKDVCERLPHYNPTEEPTLCAISWQQINDFLNAYFNMLDHDQLIFKNPVHWVDGLVPVKLLKSLGSQVVPYVQPIFDPFVQKLVLPSKSIIAFHGDIHGDVHSLLKFIEDLQKRGYLQGFKIVNPAFYMVFLGDYTDRGWYGPEVIYTILRLKIENPYHVYLVRGNHEDIRLNDTYGFLEQLQKCVQEGDGSWGLVRTKLSIFYETLPLALYLGCGTNEHKDFIVCCHGGIEIGFDPLDLLNHPSDIAFKKCDTLTRATQFVRLVENNEIAKFFKASCGHVPRLHDLKSMIRVDECTDYTPCNLTDTSPGTISNYRSGGLLGFQWNDYELDATYEKKNIFVSSTLGRGWRIGRLFNHAVLTLQSDEKNTVRGVFRAHQHAASAQDPMMRRILNIDHLDHDENAGVGKLWISPGKQPSTATALWDNIVCTFNVCPCTPYQAAGYTYDTYGLLTLAELFSDWKLQVVRQSML